MHVLVTGGAGFIGSALIRFLINETGVSVVNVDKLTYAASPAALDSVRDNPRYRFEQVDICDAAALEGVFARHRPDLVIHLAAESHVDRSIDGPAVFVDTNVVGTYLLLETSLRYWRGLTPEAAARFRFHHVSTDEVFGSLGPDDPAFHEETPYQPNSPYSATKAASDHLARAWLHTFGLPVTASNCSNNYGPFQFPEKLIPLMVINGLTGKPLPVYGSGANVRDWLHVEDHARALWAVVTRGRVGETYNIGGDSERRNIDVVETICDLLDEIRPRTDGVSRRTQISFVADRPGHDRRYAIDAGKIQRELGWTPAESFASGLGKTVSWYLAREDWWRAILDGAYKGERLGLTAAANHASSR